MSSLIPILSLLSVIVVSLLVVRVATVALVLTGLSQQLARFQARSAFTGAGFTTTESEKVIQHPVRRKIIMTLMLLGNAGIVTAVSSLMLSFVNHDNGSTVPLWIRVVAILVGIVGLWLLAHSSWIDKRVTRAIELGLKHWTELDVRDYSGLLHLSRGYSVVELEVQQDGWLAGQILGDLKLADEGILVLGVDRSDGSYVGAPRGRTELFAGDSVILYGPSEAIAAVDQRAAGREGNWDHHLAVDKQKQVEMAESST